MMLVMSLTKNLSDAERRMWAAGLRGETVDFRAGDIGADGPPTDESWGRERQVRAKVLTALLRGAMPAVRAMGISAWLRAVAGPRGLASSGDEGAARP